MQVNATGSSHTYIYHAKTGKLSTKDGSQDDFVDYFNGDLDKGQADTLTGFDKRRKNDLNAMLMFFQSGHKQVKDVFNGQQGDTYEITCEAKDAVTTQFLVNGEKVFQAYDMNVFTYIDPANVTRGLYQKLQAQVCGLAENGVQLGEGDVFELGNGYRLQVEKDHIKIDGLGSGSKEQDDKAKQLAYGLDALLRFEGIDRETTPMLLCMLRELGVNTDQPFQVNGKKYEVKDGRIWQAGSRFGVPDAVFHEALANYEKALSMPVL